MQVCRWLEEAGADAIHVSSGSTFPHPENPAGEFSLDDMVRTLRHHALERRAHLPQLPALPALAGEPRDAGPLGARPGRRPRPLLPDAAAVKKAVGIPVIVTGGFQQASLIAGAHRARRLRRRLDRARARGQQRPRRALPGRATTCRRGPARTATSACTTCSSIRSAATTSGASPPREAMIEQIMSVYSPAA